MRYPKARLMSTDTATGHEGDHFADHDRWSHQAWTRPRPLTGFHSLRPPAIDHRNISAEPPDDLVEQALTFVRAQLPNQPSRPPHNTSMTRSSRCWLAVLRLLAMNRAGQFGSGPALYLNTNGPR